MEKTNMKADPSLYVKADSRYTFFGRFVLVIKWHMALQRG